MSDSSSFSSDELVQTISNAGNVLKAYSLSERLEWKTDVGIEGDVGQFVDRNLVRVASLLDDTSILMASGRILGATTTARASLETMAIVVEFFRKFKAAVKRSDGTDIKNLLGSFIFASLEFGDLSQKKTPNIMDALRSAEKRQSGILNVYGILCEAVHPNWSGRIQYSSDGSLDWRDANVQRLMLAMTIGASFSNVLQEDLLTFQEFVTNNRKNLRNAIFL